MLVEMVNKSQINSLAKFIEAACIEVDEEECPLEITRLLEIKQKYEAYCFANDYPEENLRASKMLFKSYGMDFLVQSDSSTEVFKKLRMLTHKELKGQKEIKQLPGETSLKLFLRSRCQVT